MSLLKALLCVNYPYIFVSSLDFRGKKVKKTRHLILGHPHGLVISLGRERHCPTRGIYTISDPIDLGSDLELETFDHQASTYSVVSAITHRYPNQKYYYYNQNKPQYDLFTEEVWIQESFIFWPPTTNQIFSNSNQSKSAIFKSVLTLFPTIKLTFQKKVCMLLLEQATFRFGRGCQNIWSMTGHFLSFLKKGNIKPDSIFCSSILNNLQC